MTVVADESIDKEVVDILRKHGLTVIYIAESEPSLVDEAVLSTARTRNALLLTADKDFGELVYRRRQLSAGVILLRLPYLAPSERAYLLRGVIRDHKDALPHSFCVVTETKVRLRKL